MNLPNLLTLDTIAMWCQVTEDRVSVFELGVMLRLEGAFWEAMVPKGRMDTGDIKEIMESEKKLRTVPMNPQKAKK